MPEVVTPPEVMGTILSAYAKALAHRIKTPLSVISNDLHYFQSILPPAECARSLERLYEISRILDEFVERTKILEPKSSFDFEQIAAHELSCYLPQSTPCPILGYPELLRAALRSLRDFVQHFSWGCSRTPTSVILDGMSSKQIECSSSTSYQLFSDYWVGALGTDSLIPPFLDTIFCLHSCSTAITVVHSKGGEIALPEVATIRIEFACSESD